MSQTLLLVIYLYPIVGLITYLLYCEFVIYLSLYLRSLLLSVV